MDLHDEKLPSQPKRAELFSQRNYPYNDIDSHFVPPLGMLKRVQDEWYVTYQVTPSPPLPPLPPEPGIPCSPAAPPLPPETSHSVANRR